MLGNVGMVCLGVLFCLIGNAMFNSGYVFSWEILRFVVLSFVTSFAIITMNMNVALVIKNPKIAADISGVYTVTGALM
jgi:multisubunit Na+/H+ antiporter MnhE subunit